MPELTDLIHVSDIVHRHPTIAHVYITFQKPRKLRLWREEKSKDGKYGKLKELHEIDVRGTGDGCIRLDWNSTGNFLARASTEGILSVYGFDRAQYDMSLLFILPTRMKVNQKKSLWRTKTVLLASSKDCEFEMKINSGFMDDQEEYETDHGEEEEEEEEEEDDGGYVTGDTDNDDRWAHIEAYESPDNDADDADVTECTEDDYKEWLKWQEPENQRAIKILQAQRQYEFQQSVQHHQDTLELLRKHEREQEELRRLMPPPQPPPPPSQRTRRNSGKNEASSSSSSALTTTPHHHVSYTYTSYNPYKYY